MSDTETRQAGMAEPAEAWQKLLHKFLAKIPQVNAVDPYIRSGSPYKPVPYTKEDLDAMTFTTDPDFKAYTGYTHRMLLDKWLGDRTTTCNEFVGRCVTAMGYKGTISIGRFDVFDQLYNRGLNHVWVHASSGAQPEYGDVFRLLGDVPDDNGVRLNHIAVSLQIDGDKWYTVEGGQGGPRMGYDAIRRKIRPWPQPYLQGWVSLRALLAESQPVPYWLGGWWQVDEDPYDTYWYYFAAGGKVSCCYQKPISFLAPPVSASLTGVMTLTGMYTGDIVWQGSEVRESLSLAKNRPSDRLFTMEGTNARGVKLSLIKQLRKDAFG